MSPFSSAFCSKLRSPPFSLTFGGRLVVLQQRDGGVCISFHLPYHVLFVLPSTRSVLRTPRLNTGLQPRIPPVGYADRSNPFSPNAPCSLDPRTISLYNKPIIHKSIRGLSSIPTKPFLQHNTACLCFLVVFCHH